MRSGVKIDRKVICFSVWVFLKNWATQMDVISIRGARTHNLKNVSVDLPRGRLIVFTGVSGSGKSSLAFDTLYAEGQRRYVESLSVYARQFLELMPRPDVDRIEGLSPAISIDQHSAASNPRSTVGTVTEIADHLRVLFARAGTPYCPTHDMPLKAESIAAMVDKALKLPEGTRLMVVAPVRRQMKQGFAAFFAELAAKGYSRVRIDETVMTLEEAEHFEFGGRAHDIDVVVDRVRMRADIRERLAASFETAAELAGGRVVLVGMDAPLVLRFSSKFACPVCDYSVGTLEPRLFSANSPQGCCPRCRGTGLSDDFDPDKVVRLQQLSVARGAIEGWDARNPKKFDRIAAAIRALGADPETPWCEYPAAVRMALLYGSDVTRRLEPAFEGVITEMERFWNESSETLRRVLERFRAKCTCPECGGSGLGAVARSVYLGEGENRRTIVDLSALSLGDLMRYFKTLELAGAKAEIAQKLLEGILSRLEILNDLGLGYLSLERRAGTLSGGESQRIRLAGQIGSGLTGVMYVLDEPSIGLHQRDNDQLIRTMQHLRDLGNTVIVVEHDEDVIRAADFVVDMGPGAGEFGGEILAAGTPKAIMESEASITGRFLSAERSIVMPGSDFDRANAPWFQLSGACGHNLKHVNLRFPVGAITVVAGVSGSGKSSLINDTLYPLLAAQYHRAETEPLAFDQVDGLDLFDKVICVDQSPIGRTPRSNAATYTGLFSLIREVFAQTQTARERGYDARRFSFNTKGGRCEACQGDGVVKVEMQFLPALYVTCEVCGGKRYNRETLEVRYKGLSIAEVLELTAQEALAFFDAYPAIKRKLQTICDVGLGYIRLGQSAPTLSGGEAQRLKLATELARTDTGRTLYILDEPTTGLHFADVSQLLGVLRQLTALGNTVLVIEHNLDVIRSADWVIDMGPEGGAAGGRVLAAGTPSEIAENPQSVTGPYLRRLLEGVAAAAPKRKRKRSDSKDGA